MCEICGNPHFDFRYVSGEIPDYIWNDITRYPLRDGMQVNIRNHAAHTGLTEDWEIHSPTFIVDFVASGALSCSLKGEDEMTEKYQGITSVCYVQGQTQHTVFQSPQRFRWAGILVDRSVMEDLLADGADRVASPLDRAIHHDGDVEPLCMISSTTAHVQAVLHQLLNCPYQGELGRLFIESKALELLFLRLSGRLVEPKAISDGLTSAERDKLFHARHILLHAMDEAPTLADLARTVGLSQTKLKSSFKQLFGAPVFEYLREQRLSAAYEMLISREWNVSEAAVRVGYSSPSHFSQAFRRRYGVSPSAVSRGKAN